MASLYSFYPPPQEKCYEANSIPNIVCGCRGCLTQCLIDLHYQHIAAHSRPTEFESMWGSEIFVLTVSPGDS